ncbi:general secretion pathway protein GspC [Sorangium cellulosum]|uniref:General secretion pathway protein GspC n=1 Tax=Sorangium cellulosum TaxID=56 RepID=A0A2L0FC82_SORCE|nr:type II secretion system protein GspC [Sorangium cellulosum]AUX49153.1 general secretion pathway protein GspC [Sorangium cellulosum]
MNPDAFVKRGFPFILGALVAVAAYLQASGVSHLVARAVAPDGAPPGATALAEPPLEGGRAPSAAPILERNPFDSTTGPLGARPEDAPAGAADLSGRDPGKPPPCDTGRVVLIAVSEDPEWSFAAIEVDDGRAALGRRGAELAGRKIEDIAWDRVVLTSAGARCQMQLGKKSGGSSGKPGPQTPRAPEPSRAPSYRASSRSDVPPEIASNIRRVSETEIDIDRSAAEKIFAQPEIVTHTSAAIPEMRDNQVAGLKMTIKPGSVLESFGLQSGDLVRSVNGIDLTDPEKAMMAYTRMRSDSRVSVLVERNGRPLRLRVNLR